LNSELLTSHFSPLTAHNSLIPNGLLERWNVFS
jgi:hypothetical protein